MVDWLINFQARVKKLTWLEHPKGTLDICEPDSSEEKKPSNKRVTINRSSLFSYLDMEMYLLQDEMQFCVHLKPNQLLKYLNKGSTHKPIFLFNSASCYSVLNHPHLYESR